MRILSCILLSILTLGGYNTSAQSNPPVAGPQRIIKARYRPVRLPDQTQAIQFTWVANFGAKLDKASLKGSVPGDGQTLQLDVGAPKVKGEFTAFQGPTAVETTFNTFVPCGPGSNLGNAMGNSSLATLDIVVTAIPDTPEGEAISASVLVSLDGVRDYFARLADVDGLNKELAARPPKPAPAKLEVKEVADVTDRTIKVRLQTNQTITVDIFAYQTTSESQADGSTPFMKPGQLLRENELKEILIESLSENKPYIIRVKEVGQTSNPANRTLLNETLLWRTDGTAIKTLDPAKLPTAFAVGTPRQRRSDAIHIQISANNATSVRAFVQAFNAKNEEYQVSKEVQLPSKNDPSDPTLYEGDIPVTLGVKEGIDYRVEFHAVNDALNLTSESGHSEKLRGLSAKLFDLVELQIGAKTLRFTPTQPAAKVQTEVSIAVNGKPLTLSCSTTSAPECDIDVAGLLAVLNPSPSTNSGGKTDATKSTTSKLTFVVTVKDVDTDRSQNSSFALSVMPPDSSQAGKEQLKNIQAFASNVIKSSGDGGNSKLDPGRLRGTGIAGFLGALFRGFIGL